MYKSLNHKKSLKFSKPEEQGKWHRQKVTSWFSIILMRILMKFGVNNLEAHSKYIFLTVFVYLKIWGSYAVSKCHLPRIWPRHPQPMYKIHGLGDWLWFIWFCQRTCAKALVQHPCLIMILELSYPIIRIL